MTTNIPRYIVWSTDRLQLDDPFQQRWLLQQTLMHGRAEDIRKLSLSEIALELENLNLPDEVYSLWKRYLEYTATSPSRLTPPKPSSNPLHLPSPIKPAAIFPPIDSLVKETHPTAARLSSGRPANPPVPQNITRARGRQEISRLLFPALR